MLLITQELESKLWQAADILRSQIYSADYKNYIFSILFLKRLSYRLLSYDRSIANSSFSLKNWGHDFAPNDLHHRLDRYDAIPPKTRGDLAFLMHILGVTNSQGMMGAVVSHGILFRGVDDRPTGWLGVLQLAIPATVLEWTYGVREG